MLRRLGCATSGTAALSVAASAQLRRQSGGGGDDKDTKQPPRKQKNNSNSEGEGATVGYTESTEFFFQSPTAIKDDIHEKYEAPTSGSAFQDASRFPKSPSDHGLVKPPKPVPFTPLRGVSSDETSAPSTPGEVTEDEGMATKTRLQGDNIFFEPAETKKATSMPRAQRAEVKGWEKAIDPGRELSPQMLNFAAWVSERDTIGKGPMQPDGERKHKRRGRPIQNDGNQTTGNFDFAVPMVFFCTSVGTWGYYYGEKNNVEVPDAPVVVVGSFTAEHITETGRAYLNDPDNREGANDMMALGTSINNRGGDKKRPAVMGMNPRGSQTGANEHLL